MGVGEESMYALWYSAQVDRHIFISLFISIFKNSFSPWLPSPIIYQRPVRSCSPEDPLHYSEGIHRPLLSQPHSTLLLLAVDWIRWICIRPPMVFLTDVSKGWSNRLQDPLHGEGFKPSSCENTGFHFCKYYYCGGTASCFYSRTDLMRNAATGSDSVVFMLLFN